MPVMCPVLSFSTIKCPGICIAMVGVGHFYNPASINFDFQAIDCHEATIVLMIDMHLHLASTGCFMGFKFIWTN